MKMYKKLFYSENKNCPKCNSSGKYKMLEDKPKWILSRYYKDDIDAIEYTCHSCSFKWLESNNTRDDYQKMSNKELDECLSLEKNYVTIQQFNDFVENTNNVIVQLKKKIKTLTKKRDTSFEDLDEFKI